MNSTKQINSNFVDLLGIDLDEIRKKIENDILNGQSSDSGNGQTSGSGNTQSSDSKEYYIVSKQRVNHSEILKILLNQIEEVDFREEAGQDVDKDKLTYNDYFVTCSEKKLPAAVEHTNAFFRRFLIIPFEVTIPEEQQDKQLAKKII